MDKDEKELRELEKIRRRDRKHATTKRRRLANTAPSSISTVLMDVFRQSGSGDGLRRYEETLALQAWEGFVGESAAKFSKAMRIRSQTLIVRVSDPLWMQQLTLLKRQLLLRYRDGFPKTPIRDIYFTWGSANR